MLKFKNNEDSKLYQFWEWFTDFKIVWKTQNIISDCYYNIINGIPQLCKWFWVIFNDRDWDHTYLFIIMRKKLENMARLHRYHGHLEKSKFYAAQMEECVKILKRLEDDWCYHKQAFKDHDKKWGELKTVDYEIPGEPDLIGIHIYRENAKTEEDIETELEEHRTCFNHQVKLKNTDLDRLFKVMRENCESWWD